VVGAEKFGPKTRAAGLAQVVDCEGMMSIIEGGVAEFQAELMPVGEAFA
jgi:hypothetical protein